MSPETIKKLKALGANYTFEKPSQLHNYEALLRSILNLR
jgi:hypothetical protein